MRKIYYINIKEFYVNYLFYERIILGEKYGYSRKCTRTIKPISTGTTAGSINCYAKTDCFITD